MGKIQSKTIVFITGAYVHHNCWNLWRAYFDARGYTTYSPPWPGKNADAATLRNRQPDKILAAVTMEDVIKSHTELIEKLPEKPIIIGHSFGGLFTQVLLNKGFAEAGVAIHAVPPQGIFPYEINFLRSNAATLGFFSSPNKSYLMPFKKWKFAFTNGMSYEIQKSSYYELVIPESRRAARGGLSNVAHVDFKKEHPPLLLLAGTKDQCIPAHLCHRVFKSYKNKNSVTEFLLQDRNHFVLGEPTWEQDAKYIYDWLNRN